MTYLLYRHLHVKTTSHRLGLLEGPNTRYTGHLRRRPRYTRALTYYASRLCISVMAGTVRALENGFHRLMKSHHPDTESPKFLGELSSIYGRLAGAQYRELLWAHRSHIAREDSARAHRKHRRDGQVVDCISRQPLLFLLKSWSYHIPHPHACSHCRTTAATDQPMSSTRE